MVGGNIMGHVVPWYSKYKFCFLEKCVIDGGAVETCFLNIKVGILAERTTDRYSIFSHLVAGRKLITFLVCLWYY